MRALYIFSVYVHILAAVVWIGGMFFLVLVVVPWLRAGNRPEAGRLLRETGVRFRSVGWVCFALLLATGTLNLWYRGVRFEHFARPAWLAGPFGRAISYKLGLFLLVLAVSAVHDFRIGPRATRAMEAAPDGPEARRLRRSASLLGRLNAVLALGLVFLGVVLVRGWPW